jgi:methyl-branched lipid omega-hydroxylase
MARFSTTLPTAHPGDEEVAMELNQIDLADLEFWRRPLEERAAAFATLRAQPDLAFFAEADPPPGMVRGPGFYCLTRHAEVVEASRHPELFCSGRGTNIADMPAEFLEFFGSMINLDDPRHARFRRIVSRAFTPRFLESLKADVAQIAADIVTGIAPRGQCDFVTEVAALLPLRVIVDLMGIPRSDEKFILDRTNVILGFTDPEYVPDEEADRVIGALLTAGSELAEFVREIGDDRVRNPRQDLTTALVTAEVDGEQLTTAELASFFILLVVAGNETTRNAIAHGLHLFSQHPEEQTRWQADFDGLAPTAIEEIVRLASPVIHFRRTVTADGTRLGDHTFAAGDKVVMWYWSANRDEAVFADADRFDVGRKPNDHVGFGGPGPHFCLGAHLARREILLTFRELFRVLPDIHAAGEPDRLRSAFINGVKHLPAEWTVPRGF